MHLIIGGRYMGKRVYAEKLYGKFEIVYNLENERAENIISSGLIINLHMGIKYLLKQGVDAQEFFASRLDILRSSVIIGDEISSGIIPVDVFNRKWRDETGKVYQFLASEAEIVDRVFAGLALRLKG
ncbi:MAG: bifunctional adenosylcobinamide kinase/adenosylcobinamide-phosphate guanylyltransferase [Synergistaceae bacterium]|nr:bifunctional adenosylcobinamide kinase/adenosylcobinamide-phosphate guanylyltransferase [Synergistaceae bacterium]